MAATLPKSERLCGKSAIAGLMDRGKGGSAGCFRYKFLAREEAGASRILISVPKRNFKRAVRRNLLKRRIREAYRLQKQLLPAAVDILFVYLPKEVLSSADISAAVASVLSSIASRLPAAEQRDLQTPDS